MHTVTRRRLTERHPWLYPVAVRVHQLRRHAAWLTSGTRWATRAAGTPELPVRIKKHGSLLLRELSPDEMALQHNKVINLRLASARTDGVEIRPGETELSASFCQSARTRPKRRYLPRDEPARASGSAGGAA